MTHVRSLALALCFVLSGATAWSESVEDLERQLQAVVAQRAAVQQRRTELVAQAASLADAIAPLQSVSGGRTRASAELAGQLRQFDRVVSQLDESDRTLKNAEAQVARLRRAFLTELERESRQLSERSDPRATAVRTSELEAARRRVDEISATGTTFRPLLVVSALSTDTVGDLDRKLAVLASERTRGTEAVAALDQELAVLGGRAVAAQRLLVDLDAAARTAPQDLRLVQRQVDEIHKGLQDVERHQAELRLSREALVSDLADLQKRMNECEARRRSLLGPSPGGKQ